MYDVQTSFHGQSFAIYALCEYTLDTGDPAGLVHAEKTFNLLQKHCAHTLYGGYFENLNGNVLVGDIGNPRKAIYHSGWAMLECAARLARLERE